MKKIYISLVALVFMGCSNFTINGTICDQVASDPHATVPAECQRYSEEKAARAFDNNKTDTVIDKGDIVEYSKEKEDK